jgi:hypothetical protein
VSCHIYSALHDHLIPLRHRRLSTDVLVSSQDSERSYIYIYSALHDSLIPLRHMELSTDVPVSSQDSERSYI